MKELDDSTLVKNIKNDISADDAVNILFDRHSGIFYKMINSYVPQDAGFADKQELINDVKYYIYKAALNYDDSKNTKFSTYLGNQTRWMCLNMYNKAKRHPETTQEEEKFNKIESSQNHFRDEMINKELINKIFETLKDSGDKRACKIFTMRYIIGEKNKVMPWKKISKAVNLSIQGCINVHNSYIKKIKSRKIN